MCSCTVQTDLLLLHARVLRLQLDHLLVVGFQLLRQHHQLGLLPQPQVLVALDAGRQLLDLRLQSLNLDLEGTEVVVLKTKRAFKKKKNVNPRHKCISRWFCFKKESILRLY